jgi:hypothetical protein
MRISVPDSHTYRSTGSGGFVGKVVFHCRALGGAHDDLGNDRIPDLKVPPVRSEDVGVEPTFGVQASMSRIMLGFRAAATVEQANAALAAADVRVIGGLPSLGILLVEPRIPASWAGAVRSDRERSGRPADCSLLPRVRASPPGLAHAHACSGQPSSARRSSSRRCSLPLSEADVSVAAVRTSARRPRRACRFAPGARSLRHVCGRRHARGQPMRRHEPRVSSRARRCDYLAAPGLVPGLRRARM